MIHHLQHIADLTEICRLKGIQHVVISPGSRNAPLVRSFSANKNFICISIVDERVAAFYALGLSLGSQKAVAMICTSGTAVLNYAPALAEAFYQHVPLVAITADRPLQLIDQQDNQTIHQVNVYQNYVKASMNLNEQLLSEEEHKMQHAEILELIDRASSGVKGPVHINVPVSEPLYQELPAPSPFLTIPKKFISVPGNLSDDFVETWNRSKRRIVLCGQGNPDPVLQKIIDELIEKSQAVVLAEPISNIKGKSIISAIDRVMTIVDLSAMEDFSPDLLISFGGPVVSKRLKLWLQKQPSLTHWRIADDDDSIDTYQNRKALLIGTPAEILKKLSESGIVSDPMFLKHWKEAYDESFMKDHSFFQSVPFSDSLVFNYLMNHLPENITLHLGNSSPVRYAQLYDCRQSSAVYSNRGVSGIDGCLSTAAGIAAVREGLHLLLIGDLSFVYDSNGLWNRDLPNNLRIVVINNGGGGIFRLLPGPSEHECFEPFQEAHHPVNIKKLVEAFGVDYYGCQNRKELEECFPAFIHSGNGAAILEIKTPRLENAETYSSHLKQIEKIKI